MLSRSASALYWIGRYVQRAEFTANLIEATLRLDTLAVRPAGLEAWRSALAVTAATGSFKASGSDLRPGEITQFLLLSPDNPNSIRSCISAARANARAARTALSGDAWFPINRSWMRVSELGRVDGAASILTLTGEIKSEVRAFEGAIQRMLRNEAQFFVALGAAIERASGTARLLDVKYHLLLPAGEAVGGTVDRDQWGAILRTVSALGAYRWLYRDGLKPWLVAELLVLRDEMPSSLLASAEQVVTLLTLLSKRTGTQGKADRLARQYRTKLRQTTATSLIQDGMHQSVLSYLHDLYELDRAIATQFRFD